MLVLASACITSTDDPFSWTVHDPSAAPRVSVIHEPLHPTPGEAIIVTARPEVAAPGRVETVEITLLSPAGLDERRCGPADLTPEGWCVLEVPAGSPRPGLGIYAAEVVDDRGRVDRAPTSFSFQIGFPEPGDPIVRLRTPTNVDPAQTFDVLLAFDRGGWARFDDFADVVDPLLEGLLADPAYRWRDAQLGLWASTRPAVVTAYTSGNASRCGGNPWPGIEVRAEVDFAEVIGVIHRRGGAGWRDCAGLPSALDQRTFSARDNQPETFRHELGHALFGLGDEYTEDEASRFAPGGPFRSCCCPDGEMMTETGPGGGELCLGQDAQPCGQLWDPACFPAEPACPPLTGDCRGVAGAGLAPFGNTFASEDDCRAAAAAAAAHPGVEVAADPDDCRLLFDCDCPCMGPDDAVWIHDRRRLASNPVRGAGDDVMGILDAADELHGATCARCMETVLCLRWEEGRGRSRAQAEAHCLDP